MYGNPRAFFICSHPFYAKLSWEMWQSERLRHCPCMTIVCIQKNNPGNAGPSSHDLLLQDQFFLELCEILQDQSSLAKVRYCYHYVFSRLIFPIGRSNCECSLCLEALYSQKCPYYCVAFHLQRGKAMWKCLEEQKGGNMNLILLCLEEPCADKDLIKESQCWIKIPN